MRYQFSLLDRTTGHRVVLDSDAYMIALSPAPMSILTTLVSDDPMTTYKLVASVLLRLHTVDPDAFDRLIAMLYAGALDRVVESSILVDVGDEFGRP